VPWPPRGSTYLGASLRPARDDRPLGARPLPVARGAYAGCCWRVCVRIRPAVGCRWRVCFACCRLLRVDAVRCKAYAVCGVCPSAIYAVRSGSAVCARALLFARGAWRGVAWRGVAWRGVAWRGVAWRCGSRKRADADAPIECTLYVVRFCAQCWLSGTERCVVPLPCAVCCMLYVVCCMLYGVCSTCVACPTSPLTCWHAPCRVQCCAPSCAIVRCDVPCRQRSGTSRCRRALSTPRRRCMGPSLRHGRRTVPHGIPCRTGYHVARDTMSHGLSWQRPAMSLRSCKGCGKALHGTCCCT
jgi:hypothetical protein